jgi:hypothetical protein
LEKFENMIPCQIAKEIVQQDPALLFLILFCTVKSGNHTSKFSSIDAFPTCACISLQPETLALIGVHTDEAIVIRQK